MLQKIIKTLDKIEGTLFYRIIANAELNSLLRIAGIQLSSGVGQLKISSFNTEELRALLTALECRDITFLRDSELCHRLYSLLTFEDVREIMRRSDILPELTGPIADALPLEVVIDCINVWCSRNEEIVYIKDINE